MLLFVSGRCDIPAFYSEWLFQRFKAGFVDVRNPFNPHQISRIALTQDQIDAMIFCTKNPLPIGFELLFSPVFCFFPFNIKFPSSFLLLQVFRNENLLPVLHETVLHRGISFRLSLLLLFLLLHLQLQDNPPD